MLKISNYETVLPVYAQSSSRLIEVFVQWAGQVYSTYIARGCVCAIVYIIGIITVTFVYPVMSSAIIDSVFQSAFELIKVS